MNIYDMKAKDISGDEVQLSKYKGKVILVVNTASKCGFTKQYDGLQKLYEKYKDQDFVILGFPCNQFKNQEPGSNEDVQSFCRLNFGVEFPMFEKVDVKGENAHELFKYLEKETGKEIPWNFTKFLFNRDGNLIKRYLPITPPQRLEKSIKKLV
ncbi:glutathione peroxidase [Vallitalea okinawensis]|uniref:glutathione peroxidase n=1 Tax=Vallitalea okinawensis TaxID=2078660 RepID=UPI000CFDAB7C|nr:glutathione peroxidase [Vallitalea okinawensis]